MTPVVLGFDPSKNRLGWGVVRADDGTAIDCGVEALDVRDGGWLEDQVATAIARVATYLACDTLQPVVWVREEPITRYPSVAKDHGAVCALVDAEARRHWPGLPFWTIKPTEWRTRSGLKGNAPKPLVRHNAIRWLVDARYPDDVAVSMRIEQDAADALHIAHAGWHMHTHDTKVEQ